MSTPPTRRSPRKRDGSRVSGFFVWLGGADAELVRHHPEELMRLSAIGATILFTGIFAALSSGYAFFSVFGWTLWIPVLAVLWSGMIVNIDRLVVMTIRGSFWQKAAGAVPRLLLAAVIAVVVARPLELWIFDPEIKREMAQEEMLLTHEATKRLHSAQQSARNAFESGVEVAREALGVDRQQAVVDSSNKRVTECRIGQTRMYEEWSREINESVGGRPAGPGPASKAKEQMFLRKSAECEGMTRRAELARQSADAIKRQLYVSIKQLEVIRDSARVHAGRAFDRDTAMLRETRAESLLARERALSKLASADPDVKRMVLFITFLFLLVEILPVTAKLMAGSTVYDTALSERERTTMAIAAGAKEAEAELREAGEFSAGLHALLLRQRTAFRRRALALQRMAVRDVLNQARIRWRPPPDVVDAAVEAMTRAASEAVRGSVRVADGTPRREDLDDALAGARDVAAERVSEDASRVHHGSPPSTLALQVRQYLTGIWGGVFVFFAGATVVVVSYKILGGVDVFSKTDFTIALTIGGIVISLLIPVLSSAHGHLPHDAEGGRE